VYGVSYSSASWCRRACKCEKRVLVQMCACDGVCMVPFPASEVNTIKEALMRYMGFTGLFVWMVSRLVVLCQGSLCPWALCGL
jgi:hypothetical protein